MVAIKKRCRAARNVRRNRCLRYEKEEHAKMKFNGIASWDDGLEKHAKEISLKDFDLALVGAGAWSLPLAARIKQMGKSAIHMGGEMQLLFGIKGKRWEDRNIYNDSRMRPFAEDTPTDVNRVEDGCYW